MLLNVVLCAVIVWLLLMLLWCVMGRFLLPVRLGASLVYFLEEEEPALERQVGAVNWLRNSGLFDGTLLLVTKDLDGQGREIADALARKYEFVECCTYEDFKNGLREQ